MLAGFEGYIRLGCFIVVFAIMMSWEYFAQRRKQPKGFTVRKLHNINILIFDVLFVRLLLPLLPVGIAMAVTQRELGMLNIVEIPWIINCLISILLLDAVIYFQHRAFHYYPFFWRMHAVHHTDRKLDASTGVRFHPFEIFISVFIKIGAVILLGCTPEAVVLFEIILNATSLFNHANVHIPKEIDTWLRKIIVTPDMHRVHHSIDPTELNRNFGFNFPWWDRLFGTYKAQPKKGHTKMTLGLQQYQDEKFSLVRLLGLPFIYKD